MPITKSAKKALKVSERRHGENLLMKKEIRNRVKGFRLAVASKKKDVTSELSQAFSSLDKAAKKHFIHKNKAGRLKSRLSQAATKASLTINSKIEKISRKSPAKPKSTKTKLKPKN